MVGTEVCLLMVINGGYRGMLINGMGKTCKRVGVEYSQHIRFEAHVQT